MSDHLSATRPVTSGDLNGRGLDAPGRVVSLGRFSLNQVAVFISEHSSTPVLPPAYSD